MFSPDWCALEIRAGMTAHRPIGARGAGILVGKLFYASTTEIDFEDRLLAHLQIVVGAKLRRNESFFLSWKDEQDAGGGRSVIWIHPSLPLRFRYVGGRMPLINRLWLEELTHAANSAGGLMPVSEPRAEGVPAGLPEAAG